MFGLVPRCFGYSVSQVCSPSSQVLLVSPSTKTKKTLDDRAFAAAAPSLWNKLPCAITEEDNFNHFKSKLKTFLFRKAFE